MDCFDEMFASFKVSAKRLETLPLYCITENSEFAEYQSFINNKPIKGFANQDWLDSLIAWTKEGKKIERLRVLPTSPSQYVEYETKWCYPRNKKAGEKVSFLEEKIYNQISKKHKINADFWIFDDSKVILMQYDCNGAYLGAKLLSDKEAKRYINFYNEVAKEIK